MIITNDEIALRVKCDDVSLEEAKDIIIQLENELNHHNSIKSNTGIGLAAPQIGIAKNVAIIRLNNEKINLANCKIINKNTQVLHRHEGCLSFPGRVETTKRFQNITICDNLFFPNKEFQGMLAIACQHEIDHLNSTLFFDHLAKQTPITSIKIGPNEPCFCGKINPITNKINKYKKCCGR